MARGLAGDLIQQLHQQGLSNAEIGRRLGGYDSAILGRVEKGQRPGSNLVGPLQSLVKGNAAPGKPPAAEHRKAIVRDAQGRITSYSSKKPSAARLNQILRQAQKQGAAKVGAVADVGKFQGYEQRVPSQHLARAFRKGDTPGAMRDRLRTSGQSGEAFLLSDIKAATGAEQVADLRGVTINFYYG